MNQTKQEFLQQVTTQAATDAAFKNSLVDDPVKAIKSLTGKSIELAEGVTRIEVVDQTDPTCLYLNIPVVEAVKDAELSDEQLEAVAGGHGGGCTPVIQIKAPGFTIGG